MQFWVGVENFAKIESAKVCIDNYTLLVGPNNSGKTFLMQLVQGLSDRLIEFIDEDAMNSVFARKIEGYSEFLIHERNINEFVGYINANLNMRKEQLIKDIFGKEIDIEKLYIEVEIEKEISYQIDVADWKSLSNEAVKEAINDDALKFGFIDLVKEENGFINVLSKVNGEYGESILISVGVSGRRELLNIFKDSLRHFYARRSLFLPASRTGLMLLYRDFFVNKTDNMIQYKMEEDKLIQNKEQYGGFTQPIYEFLRFLQTYSEDEQLRKLYHRELSFFESKLIEGQINVSKQGNFSYIASNDNETVPMYLASAMINEVTPMLLALTSAKRYERLIIDEVEASLHPQKQLELVRFLNRLNNKGFKLIFSTHSDTFVSKMNNLYLLSEVVRAKQDDEIIKQFNLERNDLINPENLFVYEFIIQSNGKSIVKEIIPDRKTGYQFELFAKSAMDLYSETMRLGELQ